MEILNLKDSLIQGTANLLWCAVNFYIIAVELRFLLNWFLNINPYFEPILSLWLWTNPVFCFGRSFYPKVFGWDPAPLINFQALYFIQDKLGKFLKNINNGLPPLPLEDRAEYENSDLGENFILSDDSAIDRIDDNIDNLQRVLSYTPDLDFSILKDVDILFIFHSNVFDNFFL